MSGFGPFYPPVLQRVINHAERLSCVLDRLPIAVADDAEAAWIIGRAEEVACFVRAVSHDWQAGDLEEARAARAIGAYVDGLHAGLVVRLGVETLACCSVVETTACPVTCRTRTIVAHPVWPRHHRRAAVPGVDTLLASLGRSRRHTARPPLSG